MILCAAQLGVAASLPTGHGGGDGPGDHCPTRTHSLASLEHRLRLGLHAGAVRPAPPPPAPHACASSAARHDWNISAAVARCHFRRVVYLGDSATGLTGCRAFKLRLAPRECASSRTCRYKESVKHLIYSLAKTRLVQYGPVTLAGCLATMFNRSSTVSVLTPTVSESALLGYPGSLSKAGGLSVSLRRLCGSLSDAASLGKPASGH